MKAIVTTDEIISFLQLFPLNDKITGLQFGDTRYKKEGWIDEKILKGNHTVQAILDLEYTFDGLALFTGELGEYKIDLKSKDNSRFEFEIESNEITLRSLEYKIIEQNALQPNLFLFDYIKEY